MGKAQESIATEEVPAPWFRGRPANRWPLARLQRCHARLPRGRMATGKENKDRGPSEHGSKASGECISVCASNRMGQVVVVWCRPNMNALQSA